MGQGPSGDWWQDDRGEWHQGPRPRGGSPQQPVEQTGSPGPEHGASPGPPAAAAPNVPAKVCPHCGTQSQTTADRCPNCGKPYRQKKGGCLKWIGLSLLALVLLIAGCTALIVAGRDDNETASPPPPAATDEAAGDQEPPPAEAEVEQSGIGDGTHHVGDDIAPGTYRSDGEDACYWARLTGFSGELDDIRANGNNAPEILTISPNDAGFETRGCGSWVPVRETAPASPARDFGDGTYQVGVHIRPGTYRADGSGTCYWARLSDFSHAGVQGIITNGNSPTTIEIAASDEGFTTFGCGAWTRSG